jgi:hypothetical protein
MVTFDPGQIQTTPNHRRTTMAQLHGEAGASAPLFPDRPSGVWGESLDGYGVAGTSTTGNGVQGGSIDGFGVAGTSSSSHGVLALSETGIALYAEARGGNLAGAFNGSTRVSGKVILPRGQLVICFEESPQQEEQDLTPGDVARVDLDGRVYSREVPSSKFEYRVDTASNYIGVIAESDNIAIELNCAGEGLVPVLILGVCTAKVRATYNDIRVGTSLYPAAGALSETPNAGARIGIALGFVAYGAGAQSIKVLVGV